MSDSKQVSIIDFAKCNALNPNDFFLTKKNLMPYYYNNKVWLLKKPETYRDYYPYCNINAQYSEHIASSTIRMLEENVHKTFIAINTCYNESDRIVCALECFTDKDSKFIPFSKVLSEIYKKDKIIYQTELNIILQTIKKQKYIDPKDLLNHFWNMFIIDGLIGNNDRNNDNWGIIKKKDVYSIAPIFDNAQSLLSNLETNQMNDLLKSPPKFKEYIEKYTFSCIRQNGFKIHFFQYLRKNKTKSMLNTIKKIRNEFSLTKTAQLIDSVPYLGITEKLFFKTYLQYSSELLFQEI